MSHPGKIVQLIVFQDKIYCLTSEGHMFIFDPYTNYYEYINEGIPNY
jgi:hypothetical protein